MQNITSSMVFRVSQDGMENSTRLLNLEWAVITQLDGKKDVGEIANSLGLNLLEVRQIFSKLYEKKYIELVSEFNHKGQVHREVLNLVENELKTVCGPIAEVLCKEARNILSVNSQSFQADMLGEYLQILGGLLAEPEAEKKLIEKIYPKTRNFLLNR